MSSHFTLSGPISISGSGLHSGEMSHLVLCPAPAGSGIVFVNHDGETPISIPVCPGSVIKGPLCTTVSAAGACVSTIEHLMAALWICGIDNVRIHISGREIPGADGSALEFCRRIEKVGRLAQAGQRHVLEILAPVRLEIGDREMSVVPAPRFSAGVEVIYDHPGIGTQCAELTGGRGQARRTLAGARTFCLVEDLEGMRARGLGLGGGVHNAVIFAPDGTAGGAGLQWADEPSRHKLLDLLGDLAVANCEIRGHVYARRPGHTLTSLFLKHLLATPSAWRWRVEAEQRELAG